MYWLAFLLCLAALVCFLVETFAPKPRRIALIPLGLALLAATVIALEVIQTAGSRLIVH